MTTETIGGVTYNVVSGVLFTDPVRATSNTLYRNCVFDGSDYLNTNGYGTGKGLTIDGVQNVIVQNVTFRYWMKAIAILRSAHVRVSSCDISLMKVDGISVSWSADNVEISDNWIHDWHDAPLSGEHRDGIQMWAIATQPTPTNVSLLRNFADTGDGVACQGHFINSAVGDAFPGLLIDGAIIYSALTNGIYIKGAPGAVLKNARLATNPLTLAITTTAGAGAPRIKVFGSAGITLDNNTENDASLVADIASIRDSYAASTGATGAGTTPPPTPDPVPTPDPSEPTIADISVLLVDGVGAVLADLSAGGNVDPTNVAGNSTISVDAVPGGAYDGVIGSVRLTLDGGAATRTENMAPYTLYGDGGGAFNVGLDLVEGTHNLRLQVFSAASGGGSVIGDFTVSFVVASVSEPTVEELQAQIATLEADNEALSADRARLMLVIGEAMAVLGTA